MSIKPKAAEPAAVAEVPPAPRPPVTAIPAAPTPTATTPTAAPAAPVLAATPTAAPAAPVLAATTAAVTKSAIDSTVSSLKDGIDRATTGIETTTTQVKQGMEKVMKTAEEFVAFSQGNVEAFVKSSQIWAAGVQDLSKQMAATAQAQFGETMAVFKSLTGVKSLKDALELQSSFARSAMEKSVAESGRLTDASLKLTEQALAPITARVTTAVESFSKAA